MLISPCQCLGWLSSTQSPIWAVLDYFSVPKATTALIKSYFQHIEVCLTTEECTAASQHLEVGIMAGRNISPLAFTMAMEVIIRASRWVEGGEKSDEVSPGACQPSREERQGRTHTDSDREARGKSQTLIRCKPQGRCVGGPVQQPSKYRQVLHPRQVEALVFSVRLTTPAGVASDHLQGPNLKG